MISFDVYYTLLFESREAARFGFLPNVTAG
jgi:hypothetical protein